jgi:carboxylate-amine ligase
LKKKNVPFKKSQLASVGTELELQIIDGQFFTLAQRSKDLIRNLKAGPHKKRIKPEITQSMIEMNSGIHSSTTTLLDELIDLQHYLLDIKKNLDVGFSGGGTHPSQKWSHQKIFPSQRYKNFSHKFRYLSKKATVFGQHVHIGCSSGEDALYLTHSLARYVPQFLAISASSPFYEGIDSGFASSRATIFTAFPMSGVSPYLENWTEFSEYYYKMRRWGIIESMKDVHWDIRPKPEFGTVEIRVFDTPLTLRKAVVIAAYVQALASYLLDTRPIGLTHDLYYLYNYNRFQAARYGYDGECINPYTSERMTIMEDILLTIPHLTPYAVQLGCSEFLNELKVEAESKQNDAMYLRQLYKELGSYPKLVAELCNEWSKNSG